MSEYPPMVRDVALLLDETTDSEPIRAALKKACGPLVRGVTLFDVYRGEGIAVGKKSLAFSVIYQSGERTLTEKEVDALHQKAISLIAKEFQAVQR